jgi:hypothetical protein
VDQDKVVLAFKSPLPILEDELQKKLEKISYKAPASNHMVLRISRDGRESIAKRWVRDSTEVYYDPTRGFLSSEGIDTKATSQGFKEVHNIAKELIGSEFGNEVKWSEINFICRYIGKKHPLSSLKKTVNDKVYNDLEKIIGISMKPFSLELYSADETEEKALNEIVNWYNISVKPLILNPKYYLINIVYRQKDIEKVEKMTSDLDGIVESLIEYIESD